jgi:hypothetical protein
LSGFPCGAFRERRRKFAEAYGDFPAVESLNATVLVEIPFSKGPVSLRFCAQPALLGTQKHQLNQHKSWSFLYL